jgi:putative transposase
MIELERNRRKTSIKETKKRRKQQAVSIIKTKIDNDKLNKNTKQILKSIFLEAKWMYNYVVNKEFNENIFNTDYKLDEVPVYVRDHYEIRELKYLSSQMKQEIVHRALDNIKGLYELKEKGFHVGGLKYKSKASSIPLKQYNNTYRIVNKNHIKIQGIGQHIKVDSLNQLEPSLEPASAVLVKDNNNYYVNITAYKKKEKTAVPLEEQAIISFDLGIKKQLTCSNGLVLNYNIQKSKKEKRMQRQLSRKKKGSNNYYKQNKRLNVEEKKTVNKRKDTLNKIVNYLTSNFDIVITQNDNISAWQRLFGKRIESTSIGGIIKALKHKASTFILVDRFIPTTKECSNCHSKYDIKLDERTYRCSHCGLVIDRDYNSALNDMYYGIKKINEKYKINIPVERIREYTPVEINANTFEGLNISPYVRASFVNESGSLNVLT